MQQALQAKPTSGIKKAVKAICYTIATLIVMPLVVVERASRALAGRDVFFMMQAQLLSLLPGKLGYFVRNAYYHYTLRRCPWNCCFHFGTVFTHSETEVGEGVCTGLYCVIGTASIGDYSMLAEGVHILSGKMQHGTSIPYVPFQAQPGVFSKVSIGKNCWLGPNVLVMANIGDHCIASAGTVIKRDIPANKVVAGNPARVLSDTFEETAQATHTGAH